MSSGKAHDKVCTFVGCGMAALTVAAYGADCIPFIAGYAAGTIWLSPDIDLAHSLPSKRLGFLSVLWWPYRKASRHRGFSHLPIIGTLSRVVYAAILGAIGAIALLALGFPPIDITSNTIWFIILASLGMELSAWIHLFLDYVVVIR